MPPISCTCYLPRHVKIQHPTPYSRARWTEFLFCTLIMSKMRPPPPCALLAQPVPTHLPASQPVLAPCGDRHTVAPMKPSSTCCGKLVMSPAFNTTSNAPKTLTTGFDSWALDTVFIKTMIHVQ